MATTTVKLNLQDSDGGSLKNAGVDIVSGQITLQPDGDVVYIRDIKKDAEIIVKVKEAKKDDPDFARLFPTLPGYVAPTAAMVDLGKANGPMFDPNADADDNPSRSKSWVTYFGQFIDHDITLDKSAFIDAPVDISTLINSREPFLNLDSVYGGGPEGNPELYNNGRFILTQNGRDLQRTLSGSAILVEGRNDENLIICQIQVAMFRFHNRLMDMGYKFDEARETVTRHYQDIVLNDFLPRITKTEIYNKAINNKIKLYNPKNKRAFMPIEFSVAAYRWGHSAVRKAYVMGPDQLVKTQVFNPAFPATQDLRGGRPIPPNLIIQWSNFVEVPGTTNPQPPVNVSRKIDTLLSSGLFFLPPDAAPTGPIELAQRNLVRAKSYGIPSGQSIANELGFTPLSNAQIGLTDPRFGVEAPLWYYILAEANIQTNGATLGDVGSTLVAEVLVGLLREDKESILNKGKKYDQLFNPTFGNLIKFAGVI